MQIIFFFIIFIIMAIHKDIVKYNEIGICIDGFLQQRQKMWYW